MLLSGLVLLAAGLSLIKVRAAKTIVKISRKEPAGWHSMLCGVAVGSLGCNCGCWGLMRSKSRKAVLTANSFARAKTAIGKRVLQVDSVRTISALLQL